MTEGSVGQAAGPRLVVLAPHFPEYALRFASAMSRHFDTAVILDHGQYAREGVAAVDPTGVHLELAHFNSLVDIARLLRTVARHRPDLVSLQEAVGPRRRLFNAAVVATTRKRATILLTVHDPQPHDGRDADTGARGWALLRWVRRQAHVVLVHGDHCAQAYRRWRTAEGVSVDRPQAVVLIDHGLILEPRAPVPVAADRAAPLRMLVFGRMEKYKGLTTLLEAVTRLATEHVPFELRLEGAGAELDALAERFAALPGVTVRNKFMSRDEIVASIAWSDCVVVPYLEATQSGVVAAAFAGHRLVVASSVGGLRDVVTDGGNGLLVPPGDGAALYRALRVLAEDAALRKKLADGARATAGERLSWRRIAESLTSRLAAAQH